MKSLILPIVLMASAGSASIDEAELPRGFLDAAVIVRVGILDLGSMTVEEYARRMNVNSNDSCKWRRALGLEKYDLSCRNLYFPEGLKFSFGWQEGSSTSYLRVYRVSDDKQVDALQISMLLLPTEEDRRRQAERERIDSDLRARRYELADQARTELDKIKQSGMARIAVKFQIAMDNAIREYEEKTQPLEAEVEELEKAQDRAAGRYDNEEFVRLGKLQRDKIKQINDVPHPRYSIPFEKMDKEREFERGLDELYEDWENRLIKASYGGDIQEFDKLALELNNELERWKEFAESVELNNR